MKEFSRSRKHAIVRYLAAISTTLFVSTMGLAISRQEAIVLAKKYGSALGATIDKIVAVQAPKDENHYWMIDTGRQYISVDNKSGKFLKYFDYELLREYQKRQTKGLTLEREKLLSISKTLFDLLKPDMEMRLVEVKSSTSWLSRVRFEPVMYGLKSNGFGNMFSCEIDALSQKPISVELEDRWSYQAPLRKVSIVAAKKIATKFLNCQEDQLTVVESFVTPMASSKEAALSELRRLRICRPAYLFKYMDLGCAVDMDTGVILIKGNAISKDRPSSGEAVKNITSRNSLKRLEKPSNSNSEVRFNNLDFASVSERKFFIATGWTHNFFVRRLMSRAKEKSYYTFIEKDGDSMSYVFMRGVLVYAVGSGSLRKDNSRTVGSDSDFKKLISPLLSLYDASNILQFNVANVAFNSDVNNSTSRYRKLKITSLDSSGRRLQFEAIISAQTSQIYRWEKIRE